LSFIDALPFDWLDVAAADGPDRSEPRAASLTDATHAPLRTSVRNAPDPVMMGWSASAPSEQEHDSKTPARRRAGLRRRRDAARGARLRAGAFVAPPSLRQRRALGANTRIPVDRVMDEMKRAGYALVQKHGFLPNQYFVVFGRAR